MRGVIDITEQVTHCRGAALLNLLADAFGWTTARYRNVVDV
ncbi:hypothetical protein [Leucobacter chinensis]|nr:hypothetical protein [Leucobacter chinensis]